MRTASEMSQAQRRRAAARVRRLLGAGEVDRLVGTAGRRASVEALLTNRPARTVVSVQDGRDFLSSRRLDHPDGLGAERLATLLSRLFWILGAATVVAAVVALVVGMVVSGEDGAAADPFEALGELPGPGGRLLVLSLPVLLGATVLARWVLSFMRPVIALADARYAVRWAGARPGQLARGLPVVEPFTGLAGWLRVPAVVLWAAAGGAVLFALWLPTYDDGPPWGIYLLAAGLALLGMLPALGSRALSRAGAVAQDHLVVLTARRRGLRVDAATALQEQFLQVAFRTPLSRPSLGSFVSVREWTAYPLTAALDEAELRRRRTHAATELDDVTVASPPGQAPLVVMEQPGEHGGLSGRFDEEYAAGWLVGEAREPGSRDRVLLLVRDQPERFRTEVLPAFGQHHNLDLNTLVVLDRPEQLPSGRAWLESWVKEQSARRG
ncbi:hypothetical protein [Georgenia satyanarayanai]|uniref:hypothetical protein n=1 Tax=Georgenia satyanarayanai TaxID=860221 RepID=UPI0012655327|nr:hypothetical protein [Georgenia satyanarayanai]